MLFQDIFNLLPESKILNSPNYPLLITGLSKVHKAHFLSHFAANSPAPMLVITPDEQSARQLCEDYLALSCEEDAGVFPCRDFLWNSNLVSSHEFEHERINLLCGVLDGKIKVIFCPVAAAMQYTIPQEQLSKHRYTLKTGQEISLLSLQRQLQEAGYARRDQVEGPAQFAVRGGILDIYSTSFSDPVRVEFWGDEITEISPFDIDTQRRTHKLSSVTIAPAGEILPPDELGDLLQKQGENPFISQDIEALQNGLPITHLDKYYPLCYSKPASIFDYAKGGRCFLIQLPEIKQTANETEKHFELEYSTVFEKHSWIAPIESYQMNYAKLKQAVSALPFCVMDTFFQRTDDFDFAAHLEPQAQQAPSWSGDLTSLLEELEIYRAKNYTCIILMGTKKAAQSMAGDLTRNGYTASCISKNHPINPNQVYTLPGNLSSGFDYPDAKVVVFSHGRIKNQKAKKRKPRKGEEIRSLSDVKKGDYVVHISHGIGIYKGITPLTVEGVVKDYIKIQYAGSDILYLPVTQLDSIAKYIGPGQDSHIKINKMGGNEWKNTKTKVKKETQEMAQELLQLYAKRKNAKGFAFSEDTEWQKSFEEHFEYEETQDQLRCIKEIKHDMEQARPMDRLLCGDVGFGKTEVALRAAFKCILDSKQCVLLCPTTILAWQHYQTFRRRIGDFPIKGELLSRFRTKKEQTKILEELKTGQIDFLIGTHRMIQSDVQFKDLGLAIIDEEQRFGVKQKERFKEVFAGIDVLSLSATPIPRTLSMTMSGLRDISLLEEPPQDRYPVQSYVLEYNQDILFAAIERELNRNGQVFYLHNRVENIELTAALLQNRFPRARIGVAHGKMQEKELSKVWTQLLEQQLDILVCTTIIETGVDLPNCNTLIIENADRLGLAQLYQLRGRVGRSNRKAFAYFTFFPNKVLSKFATKRLEAIREFTEFGSGFKIALRDLEIRGAGSLLGSKQHGQMLSVGYDMYVRLLNEAVQELKGTAKKEPVEECLIDIPIQAHIPPEYIESEAQRLDIYRKIAALKTSEQRKELLLELEDRFGNPPESVESLIEVSLLRASASEYGITEILHKQGNLIVRFSEFNPEFLSALSNEFGNNLTVHASENAEIELKKKGQSLLNLIKKLLSALKK